MFPPPVPPESLPPCPSSHRTSSRGKDPLGSSSPSAGRHDSPDLTPSSSRRGSPRCVDLLLLGAPRLVSQKVKGSHPHSRGPTFVQGLGSTGPVRSSGGASSRRTRSGITSSSVRDGRNRNPCPSRAPTASSRTHTLCDSVSVPSTGVGESLRRVRRGATRPAVEEETAHGLWGGCVSGLRATSSGPARVRVRGDGRSRDTSEAHLTPGTRTRRLTVHTRTHEYTRCLSVSSSSRVDPSTSMYLVTTISLKLRCSSSYGRPVGVRGASGAGLSRHLFVASDCRVYPPVLWSLCVGERGRVGGSKGPSGRRRVTGRRP